MIVKGRFIGRKSASFGRTSNSIVEKSLFDGIAPSTEKEKTVASSSTAVKVPEFKAEYKETVLNSTNRFRAISMMKVDEKSLIYKGKVMKTSSHLGLPGLFV